jgi:hypothetical protein
MVTHMVFTPVFFFVSDGVSRSGRGAWAVFGSSLAAGPFVVSVLDLLLFFFLFFFVFRDDDEGSGPGAAADGGAARDGGGAPPPPPRASSGLSAVAAEAEDDEEGDDDEEELVSRSRLHSSLWPACHAARWQAWLQYFRCRHPEHFCSDWSVLAVPQNAHWSGIVRNRCVWRWRASA